ncbi:hypothetical protein KRR26_03605 [Corallococcus sp. M34]|uniref:hypothetical protein n=1 Tax=Citreicoccus inhibens TaxID=2849499 RepID=UPI001C2280B9|nr:hypothetical protein [Citreicoccus inhibens]MBU8894671.1 hypothetical protein [Citreicoccus inhibens]
MSAALLRKEWREHRGALILLNVLFGVLGALLVLNEARYATHGTLMEVLKIPAVMLSTAAALFVAHRLVTREYGQRTQLFLESLPLSRASILATKLLLGGGVLLLPLVLTGLALWSRARLHEDLSARFLLILGLRAATPVLLGWMFCALAGLIGRYRNPLFLLLFLALFAADRLTDFDLTRVGPTVLLGSDFAFERQHFPWAALGLCWAAILGMAAVCFGLVLHRDGTLAELLSQRMSHREKVFIACICVGLVVVISVMDAAKQRQPFTLHDAEQALAVGSPVQVSSGVGFSREDAARLATRLANDLGALSRYLGLERLPAVAVMPIRELDADVFQRAELENADGVVVRANLADPAFDVRDFEAFLFQQVLIWTSKGQVLREERRWWLDGFTAWWARRDEEDPRLSPRVAVASRDDFDPRAWLTTRERVGPCLAGALAARGITVLRSQLDEEAFHSLARQLLAWPPGTGVTGRLSEPRLEDLLRARGLGSESELFTRWRTAASQDRAVHAALLEALSRLHPSLHVVAESQETFRLEHRLRGEGNTPAGRYALLSQNLGPFTAEVAPYALSRQDAVGAEDAVILPQGLARGERWLFVMQQERPELGCPVRLVAERREIP